MLLSLAAESWEEVGDTNPLVHSQPANPAWSCGVRWGLQLSLFLFGWYRSPGESRLQRKAPSYGALTPCSCAHVVARSRSGVCVDKSSLRRRDAGCDLKGNEAISKASIEHVCTASGDGVNSVVRFSCAEINRRSSERSKRSTSAVAFQIKSPLSLSQWPQNAARSLMCVWK